MKLGIVLYSNDPETVWNAFRLANFSLKAGDEVRLFCLGKGVECRQLDVARYAISPLIGLFLEDGGEGLACGTCLEARGMSGLEGFTTATLKDLQGLMHSAERLISF